MPGGSLLLIAIYGVLGGVMINQDKTEQPLEQPREPSQSDVAREIARALGERDFGVLLQIRRIVKALGRTQSLKLLSDTLQIEKQGGMMTLDKSRRKTIGGIFLHLAYTTGQPKEGMHLPPRTKAKRRAESPKKTDAQTSTPNGATNATQKAKKAIVEAKKATGMQWEDRVPAVQEANAERGKVNTVKITIIGRPGKIVDKGQCIVTVMEDSKLPSLPKGLPVPTSAPVKYAVYISMKHWNKVKDAIQDPEDTLIIEGFPKTDAEVSAIAVFATNVTTKKLQMAAKAPKTEVKQ